VTATSSSAGADIDPAHGGSALPIGVRLGDYDILAVIRQSEIGIVYEGIERSSQRKVAIEEYLPAALADRMADGHVVVRSTRHQQSFREGMKAFLSEARTLSALAEPALVKVLDFWEQYGTVYMAVPLQEGRILRDALRASPAPSEVWLKGLLAPLLHALTALHRANIHSCDITPDTILLRGDDSPLLVDLGLTTRIVAKATDDETVVLKPDFAPLEQDVHDPSMPEGPWTDVYAVAAVIHLAITGKPPATPTSRMVSDTMPPLRNVAKGYSERFLGGLDRALAVRPEHRPQSIAEFRAAIGISAGASGASPIGQRQTSDSSPTPSVRKVDGLPEPGSIAPVARQDKTRIRVLGDGTKIRPPSPVPDILLSSSITPSTTGSRQGGLPWKPLAISAFAVALIGFGLLFFMMGEPRDAPPAGADTTASAKANATQSEPISAPPPPLASAPVLPMAESSSPVATRGPETRPSPRESSGPASNRQVDAATGVPDAGPGRASGPPPVAGPMSPGSAASGAGPVASMSEGGAASVAPARPAPRSGKVQFSIKPWGEVLVDGKSRGVSPPLKELSLPEGRHRIEIRNSTFPGYTSEIDIKGGSNLSIAHTFKAP
jgi:serine/threonine protein kinase